jgi:hypothetical protein
MQVEKCLVLQTSSHANHLFCPFIRSFFLSSFGILSSSGWCCLQPSHASGTPRGLFLQLVLWNAEAHAQEVGAISDMRALDLSHQSKR